MNTAVTIPPQPQQVAPSAAPATVAPIAPTAPSSPTKDAAVKDWLSKNKVATQLSVLALMCIVFFGGTGWALWWLYGGADRVPQGETLVDMPGGRWFGGNVPRVRPAQPRMTAPAVNRDGVRRTSDTFYRVRAGDTTMSASKGKDGQWTIGFGYATSKFNSQDLPLLTAKYNSKVLGLTDDQLKQLNGLPAYGGMVVEADDRKKLEEMFQSYLNAPDDKARGDIEKSLTQTLADVGKKSLEPTKAANEAHIQKIRSILTPEQIDKLKPKPQGQ